MGRASRLGGKCHSGVRGRCKPSDYDRDRLLVSQSPALRAQAAVERGAAFAALVMQFGQKLAAAQQHCGPALEAALKAIMAEQKTAKTTLAACLKAEDAARRKAIGKELRAKDKGACAVQFRAAGAEVTSPAAGGPGYRCDR